MSDSAHVCELNVSPRLDKNVEVYERQSGKTLATLKGHTKKINSAIFVNASGASDTPSLLASASADKTIRLWTSEGGNAKGLYGTLGSITSHTNEVTSLSAHPSGTILASASLDSTWALYDLATGSKAPPALHTITVPPAKEDSGAAATGGVTSIQFHPDGAIIGVGCADSYLRIFDVRTGKVAALFPGHVEYGGHAINSLSFAENGYVLASSSAGSGGVIQLWDLRHATTNMAAIPVAAESKVNHLRFDPSTQYLAAAGTNLKVYQYKSWENLYTFDDNAAELTGVSFAKNGHAIIVAGIDRTVRILGSAL